MLLVVGFDPGPSYRYIGVGLRDYMSTDYAFHGDSLRRRVLGIQMSEADVKADIIRR